MNRSAPACNALTTAQPGRCAPSVRALRLQLEEPSAAHCAQEGGLPRPATVANRVRVDAVRIRDAQGTDTAECAADHHPITHITVNHTGLSAEVRSWTVGRSSSTPPTKAAGRGRVDTGRHGGMEGSVSRTPHGSCLLRCTPGYLFCARHPNTAADAKALATVCASASATNAQSGRYHQPGSQFITVLQPSSNASCLPYILGPPHAHAPTGNVDESRMDSGRMEKRWHIKLILIGK